MKMANHTLQEAIYTLLQSDTELQAIATGVYDNPASTHALPYLAFGNMTAVDWSTKTTRGLQTAIPIHAYSQVSKKEVIAMLDRVYDLLQSGGLTLEGFQLIAMRFEYNEIMLESDGVTYHGMIRFRAFTEAVAA